MLSVRVTAGRGIGLLQGHQDSRHAAVRLAQVHDGVHPATLRKYTLARCTPYRYSGEIGERPVRITVYWCIDRDRGTPRGAAPPTPPGIRVRTTAVRSG